MRAAEESTYRTGTAISERDREILNFERNWFKFEGSKEEAIKEQLGLPTSTYYQALNALLDNPAALEYDALLVKRLRRVRDARMRQRNKRRLGFEGDQQ